MKKHTVILSIILFFLLCVGLGMGGQAQDRVKFPPVPVKVSPPMPEPAPPQKIDFPAYSGMSQWIGTDKFDGGINTFLPPEKLSANQATALINFLPYGGQWLKKREGYQKIEYSLLGKIYGLGMADSANTKSRLFVVGGDDFYITDDLYGGTYKDIGGTTAGATFLTSTPFGLVISNDGSDSARLYAGDSAVTVAIWALGYCDSGTAEVDSDYTAGDTAWIEDSSKVWTANYWIGYWCKCGSSLFEIFDNTASRLYLLDCADTCDDAHYDIVSRPDSVSTSLGFPRGRATAYYQDRLFVSSAFYPWRIYYSNPRLINDIDIDAMINLDMDAQDEIQRMVLFNGYLIVFASNSIYAINSDLQATCITKSFGCSMPKSIAVGDDYIYFVAQPTGVYRFNGNIYGSLSYKFEKISNPIRQTLASVGADILDNACGVYVEKQYWLSYSPDTCLVFDETTNAWYKQGFGFTEAMPLLSDFRTQTSEDIYPSANGDTADWTASTGSDYACVDDKTNEADYISTATNNKIEKFALGNLTEYPAGAIIQDITISLRVKKASGSHAGIYVDVVTGGSTYRVGLIDYISTDWTTRSITVATDSGTGLPWTETTLNALVLRLTSDTWGATISISGIWITPNYRNSVSTKNFLFANTNMDFIYQYGGVFADDTTNTGAYNVTGIVPTAYYQSGWFDLGSPVNQYQMRKFWLDKTTDANATVYLYRNHGAAAICTLTVTEFGDTTHLSWLPPWVSGHEFQIKIESAADSCQVKGWGALVRDLGERKD